eukprot:TRINITY_DN3080_c0_g1_i5.p1 TRINITY_DN3080_c0_g1~~TRINITY_DN3080_c0_g1_i5.p1  ORF type:complete len:300 (+),score=51.56 TRINITY_DN3080_c0_g1_i5:67-966(+)
MCLGPIPTERVCVVEKSKSVMGQLLSVRKKRCLHNFFDAFISPRAVWESKGLLMTEKAEGKPAMLRHYNKVLATSHLINTHSYEELPCEAGMSACKFNVEMLVTIRGKTVKRDPEWTFSYDNHTGLITRIDYSRNNGNDIQPPSPPASDRPCEHNCWDSVRVKRQWCLLRCRVCESQWRLPTGSFVKCQAFSTKPGCPVGTSCTFIHMNARKQTVAERQLAIDFADHPDVLERARVGASSRPFKKRSTRVKKSKSKQVKEGTSPVLPSPVPLQRLGRSASMICVRDSLCSSGHRSRSLE